MKWQTGNMKMSPPRKGSRRVRPLVVIAAAIAAILTTLPAPASAQPCGPDNTCNSLKIAVILQPFVINNDTFGLVSTCGTTTLYSCTAVFSTTPSMDKLAKCEAIRAALAAGSGGCSNYTLSGACDNTDPNAPFFTATDNTTPGAVLGFKAINELNVIVGGQQGSTTLNDYEEDMISSNTGICPPNDPNGDGDPSDAITSQIVFSGTGDDSKISPGQCVAGSNAGASCTIATECPGGTCDIGSADVEITVDESGNGHGVNTVSATTNGKKAQDLVSELLLAFQLSGVNATPIGTRGLRIAPRPGDLHTIGVGTATDNFKIHTDSRVGARDTLPVPTDGITPAQGACHAGKIACVSKKKSCLLNLEGKARSKGLPPDPAALQKCHDKFDGGPVSSKGCFAKLEAKGGCLTSGDTAALENKVDAFVNDVLSELDPNPANDLNKCTAGKLKCVANKDKCILGVNAKAVKTGVPPDPAALQKCHDKFDGGPVPLKGCFAKLEAKGGCLTSGDTAALEKKVDAFDADVLGELVP